MSQNLLTQMKAIITLKKLYLVYLDDDQAQLDYAQDLLSDLGVEIYASTSHVDALNFIHQNQQDIILIISDLKMPECDGFLFKEKVSTVAPQLPFVILSGYLDTDLALKCLSLKINGIINKPLDLEGFSEVFLKDIPARINSIKEDREIKVTLISDIEQFLDNAESCLISIDDFTNYESQINSFFSIIHTIKGASSFFDDKCLHKFTHKYEDGIKKIQNKQFALNDKIHANLLIGLDTMRTQFEIIKTGTGSSSAAEVHFDLFVNGEFQAANADASLKDLPNQNNINNKKSDNKEIKVNVALLDDFLKLSGEVIVIKNLLNKCVNSIEKQYAGNKDLETLTELLEELHKINGGVQNKISEIRKVPLKTIFKPIHRGVREVSRSLNKPINFEVYGEELSVDNSIAEVLNSSLLHLVKNCVDHGIEDTADREQQGKTSRGTVKLTCTSEEDAVTVILEDDGKGLNPSVISKKLISNGTHSLEQIKAMSDDQLIQMIFSPGFSTAQKVTEISGRGVGMSMVKESIESIGGNIKIESTVGKGSCFRLFLPIPKSVLIANCLFISTNKIKIGITSDEVEKVVNYTNDIIHNFENTQAIFHDDYLVPLISLNKLLNFDQSNKDLEKKIVILKDKQGSRLVGIIIDEILEFEDTIVKPIIPSINTNGFYKGATFVDEGNVSLVLNSEKIMDYMKIVTKSKKNTDTISQKSNLHSNTIKQALVFELSEPGFYAVPQNVIYRIEEIPSSEIYRSGDIAVLNYRDAVLPIVNLTKLFNTDVTSESTSENMSVIVVEIHDYKIGLQVNSILDILEYSELHTELQNTKKCCVGYFFNKEQTIGLIDFDLLRTQLEKYGILQDRQSVSLLNAA